MTRYFLTLIALALFVGTMTGCHAEADAHDGHTGVEVSK